MDEEEAFFGGADCGRGAYAIITTDANELAATIHNRMPVLLQPMDYTRWLTRYDEAQPPIDLLRPFDADAMTAWKVDPRVGNVRNNEPGLCEQWNRPPQIGMNSGRVLGSAQNDYFRQIFTRGIRSRGVFVAVTIGALLKSRQ